MWPDRVSNPGPLTYEQLCTNDKKISVSSSALFHHDLAVHKYILPHSECLLSLGAARQTLSSTYRMLTKGMRDTKLVFSPNLNCS